MNLEWLAVAANGLTVLATGFIAYHIYFLQKRLTFAERMRRMEAVRSKVEDQLSRIERDGLAREVMLVNVLRYEKDYLALNEKNRHGYVELRAEIKAIKYDGIEFFAGMIQPACFTRDGKLTLRDTGDAAFDVYPVGVVPYRWIEFVDMRGDEFRYSPIFYVRFKGKDKYPYSRTLYYRKLAELGHNGPYDLQFEQVDLA